MLLGAHTTAQENRVITIKDHPCRIGVAMKNYTFIEPSNTTIGASVVLIAATFKCPVTEPSAFNQVQCNLAKCLLT